MKDILLKYQDHVVDDKTQKKLNKPLQDNTGFNEGHEEFLRTLIAKIQSGELNTHDPQSIYNHAVYDSLSEEEMERADIKALNLISLIRQIETLWNESQKASFQIQNLVETVFRVKSEFEGKYGDVYII